MGPKCVSDRFSSSKYCVILLAIVTVISIRQLSTGWVNNGESYKVGNRRRFIAVLRLECILLLANFFIYTQLMVYFDRDDREKYDKRLTVKERRHASIALITFMFVSQMVYLMYFAPDVIQVLFFDICALLSGFWTNLLGVVAGFFIVNVFISMLNSLSSTKPLVAYIAVIPYIGQIVLDRRYQIKFLLIATAVMSLVMWFGSDRIVVKHVTIPVANFSGTGGSVKIALVSDVHAGASVHREQVAKVVDKLLDLRVDMVALVGDLVDGPLEQLAGRMLPLWLLHYRHRIYYVSGNHEYYYGDARKWFSEFGRHGIEVLNNKCDMYKGVCIVGVNDISSETSGIDGHSMNLTEAMQNCSAKSSRILLSHNPASVLTFSAEDLEKVDVVLSGHTHAGQYYVLVPLISWLLPYFHGLYDIGHGKLLVSAGTLFQGAPMKMLWMSEIWVVTLTKST